MAIEMRDDPAAYWEQEAGPKWVASREMLDLAMEPVSASILAAAALRPGERVVDVGCGAGSLTLAAATAVGVDGEVLGLDVSRPLAAEASERTASLESVTIAVGDAQVYALSSAADAVVSRFGVMFFTDSVAAFRNLRAGMAPGGRLVFACWQGVDRNPWITWPVAAIGDLAPEPTGPSPYAGADEPGPFRFAKREFTARLLAEAGFEEPTFQSIEQDLAIAGSVDDIMGFVQHVGPLSRTLSAIEEAQRGAALARVRTYVQEHLDGGVMKRGAGWWVVSARAPA